MSAHVIDRLHEFALRLLDEKSAQEVEAHLSECRSCVLELGTINDMLVESVVTPESAIPSASLRASVLADVGRIVPYSAYLTDMARLLDGSRKTLESELRDMPHPNTWQEGPIDHCRLFPCDAESKLQDAIRSLVLMESGSHFPMHEHLGDEFILILQGSLEQDDGRVFRPGDKLHMAEGTSHEFDVPKGLDLIYFNVVHTGLRIGDLVITPSMLAQ